MADLHEKNHTNVLYEYAKTINLYSQVANLQQLAHTHKLISIYTAFVCEFAHFFGALQILFFCMYAYSHIFSRNVPALLLYIGRRCCMQHIAATPHASAVNDLRHRMSR